MAKQADDRTAKMLMTMFAARLGIVRTPTTNVFFNDDGSLHILVKDGDELKKYNLTLSEDDGEQTR